MGRTTVSAAMKFQCVKPRTNVNGRNTFTTSAYAVRVGPFMRARLGHKCREKPRYKCHPGIPRALSYQPYEALIQRDRNPTIHDNIAGTREKDRGPTHMGDVSASESLKGIHESDPSKDREINVVAPHRTD